MDFIPPITEKRTIQDILRAVFSFQDKCKFFLPPYGKRRIREDITTIHFSVALSQECSGSQDAEEPTETSEKRGGLPEEKGPLPDSAVFSPLIQPGT